MRAKISRVQHAASLARFVLPRDQMLRRLANAWRVEREFRTGRVRLQSLPYLLFLDVACMCTLKCPLCYLGQGMKGRPKGLMSLETFRKAIDEFREVALLAHLYIRGEPLMNPRLPEMIAYANDARLVTSISTNLNLLDEGTAGRLIDSGLKNLIVSLDGATEETYKVYRVGGNFAKVLDNIRLLQRKKRQQKSLYPKITLQYLVFKFNLHEVPAIRRLSRTLGVDLSLQQGCLGGPGYEPYTGKRSPELIDQWIVPLESFLDQLGPRKRRPSILFDYYRADRTLCDQRCFFLWKAALINWDGNVSPCCFIYDRESDFGNIHQDRFRTIWNNDKFRHSRSLFLSASAGRAERTVCDACCIFSQPSLK